MSDERKATANELRSLLEGAGEFLELQQKAREAAHTKWRSNIGSITDAHWFAVGIIAHLVNLRAAVPGKTNTDLEKRLILTASFVQGIKPCTELITGGLYTQAAALLRQGIETVAALGEVRTGRRQDKRTPNVAGLPPDLKVTYGTLSGVAHVSVHDILQAFTVTAVTKEAAGASIVPRFNQKASFDLYGLQTTLMLMIAMEIVEINEELYGIKASNLIQNAIGVSYHHLIEAGFLQAPPAT